MSLGVQIKLSDQAGKRLNSFLSGLQVRKPLHESLAVRGGALTKRHLVKLAGSRHDTANRLGATPTGHLGRAAESVSSVGTEEDATVSITSPGISRARKAITIRPVNGNWLTIPIDRLGYGRRVREVESILGKRLFRPGKPGRKSRILAITVGKGKEARLRPIFALTKRVNLKRDASLLPTNQEYSREAIKGVKDYVGALIRSKENS